MKFVSRWGAVQIWLCATACLEIGQEEATVNLSARGTAPLEPVSGKSDWSIELGRADVAFGPLYVCAGTQAGKYCDTARLEWLESVVLNALDDEERSIGTLRGVTGPVRSWMFDFGITSLLTQAKPTVLKAASELEGHSVVLEGIARKDPHSVTFVLEIPVQLEAGAESGVPVVASFPKDPFRHDVSSAGDTLTVRFDPTPWVQAIDFEGLVRGQDCETEGCMLDVMLDETTSAGIAVRTAILAGKRPVFSWGSAP